MDNLSDISILYECVDGRGYEACGCDRQDDAPHCMYCLYPEWAHEMAKIVENMPKQYDAAAKAVNKFLKEWFENEENKAPAK